jgi:pimeloyl-ACP methyl ester carboxylesterase
MTSTRTLTEYPLPSAEEAATYLDPTRARYPDEEGFVERDGVRVFWESYGEGETTLLLFPAWSISTSRIWQGQIPFLARQHRVIVFDPRGNGRSDRPEDPLAHFPLHHHEDALAILDANGVERAVTVSLSAGTLPNLAMCAQSPDRVEKALFIGTLYPVCDPFPGWTQVKVHEERESYEGWHNYNVHAMQDLARFTAWWAQVCLPEPHSTVGVDFAVARGLQTTPEHLAKSVFLPPGTETMEDLLRSTAPMLEELARQVDCPVRVINGSRDAVTPLHWAEALARETDGELITLEGSGHVPQSRIPTKVNLLLREFVTGRPWRDRTVHRPNGRPRALYVSSPIGLGHARRDLAISRELRTLVPGLDVQWLTQDPVTRLLRGEGETVHPASDHLANESHHFESESAEHDLHCFHSFRRMNEVLTNNFMVFHELMEDERFDLVIADEAWDLDYFLHEHPELKRAPLAWMTDFVGMLPFEDGGDREAFISADFNADMIDHIAHHPQVRDQAIFVGNPEDIVPERFGPDLPDIGEWTEEHFDFAGYVTGFDTATVADREALRAELGYSPGEQVCVVTVGGSGVGGDLLRRVIAAYPDARAAVPGLRMVVVAGPRIDPASLPAAEGLEVRAFVPDLYKHLAACDLAVVQGGLTTSMELTANRRPFLYFPLRHHFEQCFHVAHRLDRYGAGRRMEFDASPPSAIAEAIADEIGKEVDYRPVETDGARRAAGRLAEML